MTESLRFPLTSLMQALLGMTELLGRCNLLLLDLRISFILPVAAPTDLLMPAAKACVPWPAWDVTLAAVMAEMPVLLRRRRLTKGRAAVHKELTAFDATLAACKLSVLVFQKKINFEAVVIVKWSEEDPEQSPQT
jgi:hypothetical protein